MAPLDTPAPTPPPPPPPEPPPEAAEARCVADDGVRALDLGDASPWPELCEWCCPPDWNVEKGPGVDAGELLRGGKREDEMIAEKLEFNGEVAAEALGAGLWDWGGRREGDAVWVGDGRLVASVRLRRALGWDAAEPQADC